MGKSMADEFAAMKARIPELEAEIAKLTVAAAEQVAKHNQAMADVDAGAKALAAALESEKAKHADAIAALASEKAEHVKTTEALKEAKKALEFPAYRDAVEGAQKPVADGGAAGSEKDWIAELNRRNGAEKIEFYRQNKAAIDTAYARLGE